MVQFLLFGPKEIKMAKRLLDSHPEEHQVRVGVDENCSIAVKVSKESQEFSEDTLEISVRSFGRDDFVQKLEISCITKEQLEEIAEMFQSLADSFDSE